MDAKDVIQKLAGLQLPVRATRKDEAKIIAKTSVDRSSADASKALPETDSVDVTPQTRPDEPRAAAIRKISEAATKVNSASSSVKNIDGLVSSLEGVVAQAQQTDLPHSRKAPLEKEANELATAIVSTATGGGESPNLIAGEETDVDIEVLRKSLKIIFPGSPDLKVSALKFSPPEAILNTVKKVSAARKQLESLRASVNSSEEKLAKAFNEVDVASQNTEAAQATVSDLDKAIELGQQVSIAVLNAPRAAQDSHQLSAQATRLLD